MSVDKQACIGLSYYLNSTPLYIYHMGTTHMVILKKTVNLSDADLTALVELVRNHSNKDKHSN